jgi:hypothetical protein
VQYLDSIPINNVENSHYYAITGFIYQSLQGTSRFNVKEEVYRCKEVVVLARRARHHARNLRASSTCKGQTAHCKGHIFGGDALLHRRAEALRSRVRANGLQHHVGTRDEVRQAGDVSTATGKRGGARVAKEEREERSSERVTSRVLNERFFYCAQ